MMTDLSPQLTVVDDGAGTWLLTLPLSDTGSSLAVTVGANDLRAVGRALRRVKASIGPSTVYGDGFDLNVEVHGDALFVEVHTDPGVSVVSVLPVDAVDQLTALVNGAV